VNTDRYQHIDDKELLDKFYTDGNNEWLGILLQRYTLLLLGTCMKYLKNEQEAKDSVQQIFLKVITEAPKYKIDYFKSWLYMVTRNYCLMQLRNKNIILPVESESYLQQPDETDKTELLSKEEKLRLMESSLEELNDEQKKCVVMFYIQKKTYNEIAANTGFSLMQVKSHIQNGKRNLKISIERKMKSA
jgi:RNA polymerase sigma factor (sigma-70 family)